MLGICTKGLNTGRNDNVLCIKTHLSKISWYHTCENFAELCLRLVWHIFLYGKCQLENGKIWPGKNLGKALGFCILQIVGIIN